MPQRIEKERNAARSRAAILDAAEQLFAERGYDATSLTEVGAAAGVSRGTPGYFFGSKADLYRAVLERAFAEVREAVRAGRARALASSQSTETILAGAVSDYFEFLAARPNFIRLIEREALSGRGQLEGVDHVSAGQEALAAIENVGGLSRLIDGGTDHPWNGLDAETAYQAGMIEGAAAALDVTVAELLDEFGLG